MNVAHKPIPGFSNGYAYNAGISAFPHLWRGMVGAWIPQFGRTGPKLFDQSPYKNYGLLTNMDPDTDWVVGQMGYHLDYDGSDDYVDCGDRDIFSFTDGAGNDSPFSISSFVRLGDFSTNHAIICKYKNASAPEWLIQIAGSEIYCLLYNNAVVETNYIYATAPFTSGDYLNLWAHIVITYDGSESQNGIKIYINSFQKDNARAMGGTYTGMSNTATNVRIGACENTLGSARYPWLGQLGPIYLFKRILTPSEILQLYLNPFAPFELQEMIYGKAAAVTETITLDKWYVQSIEQKQTKIEVVSY